MRNNETGEFELVVGNRQLLSAFFIVVLLFAVSFAMGYVVGQNTQRGGKLVSDAGSSNLSAPNANDRPQPAAPVPAPVNPAAGNPVTPPTTASIDPNVPPQPTTQPAQAAGPPADQPPASPPPTPTASASTDLPAGSFWQVMAVGQDTAEAMRQTLTGKGFPVVLAPGPNNLTRVLVGPYSDNTLLGRAKTDLENVGIHPVRFKREQ